MNYLPSDEVRQIRSKIDHPVIDSDGHLIEYIPVVRDFIAEDFGKDMAAAFDRMTRSAAGRVAFPTPKNAGITASSAPRSGASRPRTRWIGRPGCCRT